MCASKTCKTYSCTQRCLFFSYTHDILHPAQKGVDMDEVKKNSYLKHYPSPEVKVVHGGLRWHSGIVAPGLGMLIFHLHEIHRCDVGAGFLTLQRQHPTSRHAHVAGDPSPSEHIEAETSDDEDAPITSNDELFAAVAAVRLGY